MLQYSNGSRRAISGAGLAQLRRRMSAAERACLAADIVDGRIVLQGLTVKAIAALVGVNVGYVDRACVSRPNNAPRCATAIVRWWRRGRTRPLTLAACPTRRFSRWFVASESTARSTP